MAMMYQTIRILLESSLEEKYVVLDAVFGQGNYTLNYYPHSDQTNVHILPWISSEFVFSEGPCEELKNMDFKIDLLRMDFVTLTPHFNKDVTNNITNITNYNGENVTYTVKEDDIMALRAVDNYIKKAEYVDFQIVTKTHIFDCDKLLNLLQHLSLPTNGIHVAIQCGYRLTAPLELRNCEAITKFPKGVTISFSDSDGDPILKPFQITMYNFLKTRNVNKFIDDMIEAGYEDWL